MPASEHLNWTLFHGTNVPFTKGEVIEPMGDIGSQWSEEFPETGDYAHATNELPYAKMFAERAHEHFGEDVGEESRPRVFKVEPVRRLEMEIDPADRTSRSFRSKHGFRVVGEHPYAEYDDDDRPEWRSR